MNDINNNFSPIVSGITNKTVKHQENINNNTVAENQINEIHDNGLLGKSQVSRPDNINSDIEFCKKSTPEFLQKCDCFFENAFNTFSAAGDENAYVKACVLSKEFANEFV